MEFDSYQVQIIQCHFAVSVVVPCLITCYQCDSDLLPGRRSTWSCETCLAVVIFYIVFIVFIVFTRGRQALVCESQLREEFAFSDEAEQKMHILKQILFSDFSFDVLCHKPSVK